MFAVGRFDTLYPMWHYIWQAYIFLLDICISVLPSLLSWFCPFSVITLQSYEVCWLVQPLTQITEVIDLLSYQGTGDYFVMLTVLLRQLSSFLFCLSVTLACSFSLTVSVEPLQVREYFFFFSSCNVLTSPTLNPLCHFFSALCAGKPHYLYPPSALLAFSFLPSCSCSNKTLRHER